MALQVTSGAPSLLGGVSQQPAAIRLSSQGSRQVNLFPSVVEGLSKRHPLDHLAVVTEDDWSDAKIHTVNRSLNERYAFSILPTGISVWDLEENQAVPVSGPYGTSPDYSYLSGGSRDSFKALTVADSTFILNSRMVTRMSPDITAPDRFFTHCFVWVRAGTYNSTYKITLKLAGKAEQTVSFEVGDGSDNTTGDPQTIPNHVGRTDTAEIALGLTTALQALQTADTTLDLQASQKGSVVRIHSRRKLETFTVSDGRGGTHLVGINRKVDTIEDLPLTCRDDYKVKVVGSEESGEDDYWVRFVVEASEDGSPPREPFGSGYWEESVAPEVRFKFKASTLPHRLTRKTDDAFGNVTGTAYGKYFEWAPVPWVDREIGDDQSNPAPSFISSDEADRTISDVFFFNGRLGILSGQSVVLSEVGVFFNFWRTTVQSFPDSEVIDATASHTRVSELHSAVPFKDRLILFSDRTQFVLSGDPALTPQTVQIIPELEFENQVRVEPASTGSGILFPFRRGDYSGVREMQRVSDEDFDAFELTGHVPKYIEGKVTSISATTIEDVAVVLADGDRTKAWVYKWSSDGAQRAQSAWSVYQFGGTVLSADFIDNTLYLLIEREGSVHLEASVISNGLADPDSDIQVYLDRRIKDTDCTSALDGNGNTVYTLPYAIDPSADFEVVSRATETAQAGHVLTVLSKTSSTVTVAGDTTSTPMWLGEPYESVYEFTPPRIRSNQDTALLEPVQDIVQGHLEFEGSAYFKVLVTAPQSRDSEIEHTGPLLGNAQAAFGIPRASAGTLSFPIRGQARRSTIELSNPSPLPSRWISCEWEIEMQSSGLGGGSR